MKLIEFKTTDPVGNEYIIYISTEYIESIYTIHGDNNKIRIGLASGNSVVVNLTLEEVKEKLGIDIERRDYKRTDQTH
jgi:hypothetical protein